MIDNKKQYDSAVEWLITNKYKMFKSFLIVNKATEVMNELIEVRK